MAQSLSYPSSEWIGFLRNYGPIPRNDNMYDETIQRASKRKKIQPPTFETAYLDELIENFQAATPKSVILTGTAGDGKTYYCRQVWDALGGSLEVWQKEAKNNWHVLPLQDKKLVVVKDLSELTAEEKQTLLPHVAAAIVGKSTDKVFLIAANDGQLVEAWTEAESYANVKNVRQAIENLLVEDRRQEEGFNVKLYNLSRQSAAVNFPRILDAVLDHSGWACDRCTYQTACPIWQNKSRLEGTETDRTARERLTSLLELCELNEMHLPVRQLLLLVANALLGHPEAKEKLLSCKEIPAILEKGKAPLASLYRNIFGENLGERKRESTDVFKVLRSFGIGTETSNQIDNILIFGADDPELRSHYDKLVSDDSYYGADLGYQVQQRMYLEGGSAGNREDNFLKALQTQRQRLFYTLPHDYATDLKLWNLTVFQYAGEYLNGVYKVLKQERKLPKHIISRLVRGLNRIFTGLLVNNEDELILATSGSYSQAKISRVHEEFVSVPRKRGESVTVELDSNRGKPILVVRLSQDIAPASFNLTITRYEYLSKVAEGALPSSFSQECYEDVLAFKTQVLKQLSVRKQSENEGEDTEESMSIRLLEVNNNGIASPRTFEVYV
jgi:hypothetical protein